MFYSKILKERGFGGSFQTPPNYAHPPVFEISGMFDDRFVSFSFKLLKKVCLIITLTDGYVMLISQC